MFDGFDAFISVILSFMSLCLDLLVWIWMWHKPDDHTVQELCQASILGDVGEVWETSLELQQQPDFNMR